MPKLPPGLFAKGLPILIFVIPFAVNYGFIIDHFYNCQAWVLDSGWLANMGWRNSWALVRPTILDGESSLQTHIFGLFWLTSALSYIVPLNMVQSYALYQGIYYALPAVTVYGFLLAQFPGLRLGRRRLGAAFLSLLFAFNGISQVLMSDAHPEIAGATFAILFLVLWTRRCYVWAIAPFLLCLLVREDMGFHLVGILGLVLLVLWRKQPRFWQKPFGRWTLGFTFMAFCYGVGAIALQKYFFPSGDDALARVYLGEPAFAHVSQGFLQQRFIDQIQTLHYLYLPAIATLGLALYPRWRPSLLIGFLAYLPWYLLHSLAITGNAGILSNYYTFPYIISLAWPLIWPWSITPKPNTQIKRWGIRVFITGILLSILGTALSSNVQTLNLSHFKRGADIAAFDAVTTAVAAQDDWGRVYVDESIAVLLPREFESDAWLTTADHDNLQPADNLLYCEPSAKPEGLEAILRSQSFTAQYRLKGTPLKLQTNWELEMFHPRWIERLEPIPK